MKEINMLVPANLLSLLVHPCSMHSLSTLIHLDNYSFFIQLSNQPHQTLRCNGYNSKSPHQDRQTKTRIWGRRGMGGGGCSNLQLSRLAEPVPMMTSDKWFWSAVSLISVINSCPSSPEGEPCWNASWVWWMCKCKGKGSENGVLK